MKRIASLALVVGLLAGVLDVVTAGGVHTSRYRSEVVLPVGTLDPAMTQRSSYQVATASLGADYARLEEHVRAEVGSSAEVTLSPVPSTRLLRVRATSQRRATAERAAVEGAGVLKEFVAQLAAGEEPEADLTRYARAQQRLSAATNAEDALDDEYPDRPPVRRAARVRTATAMAAFRADLAYRDARATAIRDGFATVVRGRPVAVTTEVRTLRLAFALLLPALVVVVFALAVGWRSYQQPGLRSGGHLVTR